MTTPCTEFQDRLLAQLDQGEPADAELSRHLAACSECSAVAKRHARISRAMRDLSRQIVPAELSGRVVSACNAGYRQDRVVAMVKRLRRGSVPTELDEKMLRDTTGFGSTGAAHIGVARAKASEVLDRLVEEDLRNPAEAAVRRFASRLSRVSAPSELRTRLERMLQRQVRSSALPRVALRRMVIAATALLLGYVSVLLWLEHGGRPTKKAPFEVQRITDVAAMDPMVRSLLSGLSGGLVQTTRIISDEK